MARASPKRDAHRHVFSLLKRYESGTLAEWPVTPARKRKEVKRKDFPGVG
jgi:hypothetical protein